eukprot:1504911-Pleurochrysis_carterae.AAC.1
MPELWKATPGELFSHYYATPFLSAWSGWALTADASKTDASTRSATKKRPVSERQKACLNLRPGNRKTCGRQPCQQQRYLRKTNAPATADPPPA